MIYLIYGFVGTFDDISNAGVLRGNGKTNAMTYYLYQDFLNGNTILTNYKTSFSTCLDTQDIIELFFNKDLDLKNISIGIDEIQLILNSIGTKGSVINFVMKMAGQTRKRRTDIYYTTQRYYDLHLRMRTQTDFVLEPYKVHYHILNDSIIIEDRCIIDKCKRNHLIIVMCKKPKIYDEIDILNALEVGQLYDTNEIIDESIEITKTKTKKSKNISSGNTPISIKDITS